MRLLVTGGAGFIGTNFVYHTLEKYPDVQIRVLDAFTYASNRSSLDSVAHDIDLIEGNITDTDLVHQLISDVDVVVHFAAETHVDNSLRNPEPFLHSNIMGTFSILEAVRAHRVRLHHISTDEVYGELALNDPKRFTSQSPYRPSSPYSSTKASADLLVQSWIRSYGIAATISHCSNNYGPFQHIEKFIPRQITNLLTGRRAKLYGNGSHVRDWIHVDDHNDAVWKILQRGILGRSYVIGANGEQSNLAVLQSILTVMGYDADDFDFVPDRAGHDIRYAIDSTQLKDELDWSPRYCNFHEGLRLTIDWYQQNQSWWRPYKDAVEQSYYQQGR